MVDGRVDDSRSEPKVLVDFVTINLEKAKPFKVHNRRKTSEPKKSQPIIEELSEEEISPADQAPLENQETKPEKQTEQVPSPLPAVDVSLGDQGVPPPPDAFPQGWDLDSGIENGGVQTEPQSRKLESAQALQTASEPVKVEQDQDDIEDTQDVAIGYETETPMRSVDKAALKSSLVVDSTVDWSGTKVTIPPPIDVP